MQNPENKKTPSIRYSVQPILEDVPDLEQMDAQALKEYLEELEEAKVRLDLAEPRSQRSDAYEEWAQEHEDLEDLIDEVLDRIEDLT